MRAPRLRHTLTTGGCMLAFLAGSIEAQVRLGVINPVVGTGECGFSGERGPAWEAQIDNTRALATDTQGRLFIADTWNHRVRVMAPDGTLTTVAGTGEEGFAGDNGPAVAARLSHPGGLALDARGNLYISDSGNARIRRVAPDGTITTIAGTGTHGYGGDGGRATDARLFAPAGLAVDAQGNLFIADGWNFRVRKVTAGGTVSTVAGTGQWGYSGDGGRAGDARLGAVHGLALDDKGNLYVSDPYQHTVRRISSDGRIFTAAGGGGYGSAGDGGSAEAAQLRFPKGLALDRYGNLYIADALNHRVRAVTPAGVIVTVAGLGAEGYAGDGGPSGCARFHTPYAVAADSGGTLYIADLHNYRVRYARLEQVSDRPALTAASVVSAASSRAPVAPGSLVSIYGSGLASGACAPSLLPVPPSVAGAAVTIGGRPAPLMYVSPNQINAQVPRELPAGLVVVRANHGGLDSQPVHIDVAAAAPGVFLVGDGRGAVLNQDYSLNSAGNPAARGSAVIIYGTGQGRVQPPVEDGAAAPSDPLATTPASPEVTIGGLRAQVVFSGLAPGFVGLWQVNAIVPAQAPVGSQVALRLTLGGAASNQVTLAVR